MPVDAPRLPSDPATERLNEIYAHLAAPFDNTFHDTRGGVELECDACGEPIERAACFVRRAVRHFCSVACQYQYYRQQANLRRETAFWERVDASGGADACWPWTGTRSRGYGQVKVAAGQTGGAHVYAYTVTRGDPGGLDVLHHCDNPPCCNPRHLFLGTAKDNARDMIEKGRGHWPGHSKLTPEQRLEIARRRANGERLGVLAAEYGIDRTRVWQIAKTVA